MWNKMRKKLVSINSSLQYTKKSDVMRWTRKKEEKNFTRKSDDQNENKTINTEKNGHLLAKMIGEEKKG